MLDTKSVKHNYIYFHWIPDDVLEVAEISCRKQGLARTKANPFSACLRDLEIWKDARLKELDRQGIDQEQLTEEMLWLDIEWPRMVRYALRFFSASCFQKIFPVVMDAGFARQRYIKRHAKSGIRVCDENGIPLVYATYQEAQDDSENHPGKIIHQAFFESEELNKAIAALDRPAAPPSPDGEGVSENKTEEDRGAQRNGQAGSPAAGAELPPRGSTNDAARVGNPYTASNASNENISPPSPKNQGVSTFANRKSQTASVAAASPPSRTNQGATVAVAARTPAHSEQGGGVAVATRPPSRTNQGGVAPSTKPLRRNTEPLSQKSEGPSQNDQAPSQKSEAPLRQSTNHTYIPTQKESESMKEEKQQQPETGAAGAVCVDISLFDFFQPWSQMAILDLEGLIFPLPTSYSSDDARRQTLQLYEETAALLANDPDLQRRGLVFVARLMYYLKDEGSPCQWRPKLRAIKNNPNLVMQPWHLTANTVPIAAAEMDRADWWPQAISPSAGLQNPAGTTNALANPNSVLADITVLDLAELAGMAEADRQGMDRQEAINLVASIRTDLPEEEFPGVFSDYGALNRWQKARGYSVEFWPVDGLKLVLYSRADWDRVIECAQWLGAPDLRERLAALCANQMVPSTKG